MSGITKQKVKVIDIAAPDTNAWKYSMVFIMVFPSIYQSMHIEKIHQRVHMNKIDFTRFRSELVIKIFVHVLNYFRM